MAITRVLGSLNLHDGVNYWTERIEIGAPLTEWEESRAPFGINRQRRVRTSALRQITIGMIVYGATANALRAALATLRAECAKATNTLSLGQDGDSTVLSYACLRQTQPSVPWTTMYNLEHRAVFDLVLICEPFAYGSEVTLYNASAGTCPRVVDLSGMLGDFPAPLEITLAATVEDIAACYLGLVPDTAFDAYNEAEALTWSGGTTSTVADAAAHGGSKKRNTSATAAVATYADTAGYDPGTYLLLARTKDDSGTIDIGYGYGGSEYASVAASGTTFHIVEVACLALPIVKTRSGVAANLQVRFDSITSNGDVDWFGLCPVTWGFTSWVHPSNDATTLVFGYDGTVYADGVASQAYKTGGPLYAFKTDALCIFCDDANGSEDALPANLTIKYVPRYAE